MHYQRFQQFNEFLLGIRLLNDLECLNLIHVFINVKTGAFVRAFQHGLQDIISTLGENQHQFSDVYF